MSTLVNQTEPVNISCNAPQGLPIWIVSMLPWDGFEPCQPVVSQKCPGTLQEKVQTRNGFQQALWKDTTLFLPRR